MVMLLHVSALEEPSIAPLGKLEGVSFTRDFERWLKRALAV
jgi:hypothetical protein